MNELEITQWLEKALRNPRLKLQVKVQTLQGGPAGAYALMVMINRPIDLKLNYDSLTTWFQATVSAQYPQVRSLTLYSRPFGQHAADWKRQVKLPQAPSVDPMSTQIATDEPLNLSSYCFIEDPRLLTSDLPQPPGLLSQAILAFHRLSDEQKREVLPLLPTLFENPTSVSTVLLSVEAALWIEPLKTLNQQQLRLLSIWLSRYCFDPNTTLADLTSGRTTGQLKRSSRSPQMGIPLTLASFAGNLTVASAVTVGLLFGMVFVLSLAIMVGLEGSFSFGYLIFAILITLAFNGLIFFLSPFLMDLTQNWLYRTEWVSLAEVKRRSPEAATVIEQVCQKQKLKQPKLGLIRDQNPTAFTYGSLPNTARIVVSEGLFTYLEDEEVATVYAHELGHVIHWDFAIMTLAATLVQITYLIYIYARDSRPKDNKDTKGIHNLAFIAYIFYVAGSYLLLYLSRVREYFADHFAAEVTGNPNALARALVKIAYGIVQEGEREQDDEIRQRSRRLLEGTRALGIYDAKAATTVGTAYRVAADPAQVGKVFLWDLFNPWAGWMELNSTHPLTGKRVRALSTYAEQLDLPTEFDMAAVVAQGKHLNRQQLYGGFLLDLVLLNAVWIGAILGVLLGIPAAMAGQFNTLLGLMILGASVGQLLQTGVMYPSLNNPPVLNVLKAMSNPYASPLRGLPMQLEGRIIGRGDAGYAFGSDLKFQDESGMIFLRYASRFGPLGNFLFGANQVQRLIGEQGSAVGWFRRGVVPWVDLARFQSYRGQVVTSHPLFWQWVFSLIGIGVAIGLMLLG
ncbi:MAG: M48 family metalloprotease [Thermostichus sp. DG_1_6_bins_120]